VRVAGALLALALLELVPPPADDLLKLDPRARLEGHDA
jgi:hypothetical protein